MVTSHVHISYGAKTGPQIPTVGMSPELTCRPDVPCKRLCYGRIGRYRFAHTKNLLEQNYDIWVEDPQFFEKDVSISAIPARFFRWFPVGDIPSMEFLEMMLRISDTVQGTRFLSFTKQYDIVDEYLDNHPMWDENRFVIIESVWGDELVPTNRHNLPLSYVRFKNKPCFIPPDALQCIGDCSRCILGKSCWDLKRGESVVLDEH